MGIPTLISTHTASSSSSVAITSGIDSTYDEYMFVFTDIHPATDQVQLGFQVNATDDAGGGYDTSLITSSSFYAYHKEDDTGTPNVTYYSGGDLAQSANYQPMTNEVDNDNDSSAAGILHLFSPSSTTYVKHFYSRFHNVQHEPYAVGVFIAGYINDTTAIGEISFKFSSGNIDAGTIQMYGIA